MVLLRGMDPEPTSSHSPRRTTRSRGGVLVVLIVCLVCCGCGTPEQNPPPKQSVPIDLKYLESLYDIVRSFSEGRAAVRRGVNWAYVNESGDLVTKFIYSDASDFSEGLARVAVDSPRYGYIDRSGAIVIPPRFAVAGDFKESLAYALEDYKAQYGYIDKSGTFIIPPQFGSANDFSQGFAGVEIRKKWGFIDKAGKYLVRPLFRGIGIMGFSEGLAAVETDAGWGFIDMTGAFAIKPQFDDVYSGFVRGSIPANLGGLWGYIDKTGKFFIKPRFNEVQPFYEDVARVRDGDRWGCINPSGESVVCTPGHLP